MEQLAVLQGWATYLRVSDEDKQSPERSFAMQRQRIQEQLLTPSKHPLKREYCDILTGTSPNRHDYQLMLSDAEVGSFSHLGLYRADRFGRHAAEGLQAATKLISLGIKIRVANMPTLTPESPDGFFMFLLQMGLAQREVDVLRQRTQDGMEAKLRAGGWPHKAPEGYVNKEKLISSGKYERWVEIDQVHSQGIRMAWDLLLTGRFTLEEICKELTKSGHVRSTGRPWAWTDPKTGKRTTAKNRLHKIFHTPFYAGWVESEKFRIELETVKGNWEPTVTLDEYRRGVDILLEHGYMKSRYKRKIYLLRNILWVRNGKSCNKMYGSTPSGRTKSYSYYITHARTNGRKCRIRCEMVDSQIPEWLNGVTVDRHLLPAIRDIYHKNIARFTRVGRRNEMEALKRRIGQLKLQEARLARLLITDSISRETYQQLRSEWQERIRSEESRLAELKRDINSFLDDLDVALLLMNRMSELFCRMSEKQHAIFLQIILKQIIVDIKGNITDYELNRPFAYLEKLTDDCRQSFTGESGSDQVRFGVLSQDSRVPPDDGPICFKSAWLFLSELRFESREKVATLLELMPGLESR